MSISAGFPHGKGAMQSMAPQLVEKPCLKEKRPFLQGEYEGAGAPSCWIECLQKACVSRRLRRAAAAFR
ncbi:hypothetical protein, partial [Dysosmobacter sp. HCP28S3_G4]|uniref:hypothetical protein n=1 Tax=Dysosmobacter sp. HCP28S3_G4 TaxID=3438938 RepID=UPI003F895BD1